MIEAERIILRQWVNSDLEPFVEMNQDPSVLEYFPRPYSPKETQYMMNKMKDSIAEKEWGFWACDLKDTGEFIGFIGIEDRFLPEFLKPLTEIGWRLRKQFWKKGYATEGAKASLDYAFNRLKLEEVIAFTPVENRRSRRVMEKLGMKHDLKDDFDHPKVPDASSLKRHVLYRIQRKKES